jgi:hypothetical protein
VHFVRPDFENDGNKHYLASVAKDNVSFHLIIVGFLFVGLL